MTTQAEKLMTAEEFAALGDVGPAELIQGRVVYLTRPKPRHGRIAQNISKALDDFVRPRRLGQVYGSEIGFIVERNPDTISSPDVSFVRAEIADAHDEDEWYPHGPDLAVEVLSPNDRHTDVQEKVRQWFQAGCRSVWVVDPAARTATIHRAGGRETHLAEADVLADDSVLAGFSMPLRDAFA